MQSMYSNVCNVSSTREETTLLFGTNQTLMGLQQDVSVELHRRIVMSPYTAKRLNQVLKTVMASFEAHYGSLSME